MLAIDEALLLHEPPEMEEVTTDVAPTQKVEGPLRVPATGAAFTVIFVVAMDTPQPALTE